MPRFSQSMLGSSSIILAVAINILFGLEKLINLLGIEFNYFYSPKVIDIVIFSPSADLWIWAASLLFILFAIVLKIILCGLSFPRWMIPLHVLLLASLAVFPVDYRVASLLAMPLGFTVVILSVLLVDDFLAAKRKETALLVSMGIIGMLITLEFVSLMSWVFNAFSYEAPFGPDPRWSFPWVDLQLFNVLYPLIPLLFLVLLYSWIWIPVWRYLQSRTGRSNHSSVQRVERLNSRLLVFGLILSVASSVFITCYPYMHLPSSTLVGVDSVHYYEWLKGMVQNGPATMLGTDRPLFNLLMYCIKYVTFLSPEAVVRIMPTIAAVCLSLVVFWFVRVGTKDERLALLSSLFSSFSFQTTVSVFAYSLANWLAIIETFLLLVFLLKGLNGHSWRYMLISALIGMATLLTHPYTWTVSMVILTSYLVWTFLRKPGEKRETASLAILLAANLLFYMFYTLAPFGKGLGNGETGVLNMVTSNIGVPSLLRLQNGLGIMVSKWVGGLFGNPLIIILAVVGMFSMIDFTRSLTNFHRLVILWVVIPSLALLAIPPVQEVLFYRLVYLVPFQILAALGLNSIFTWLKNVENRFKLSPRSSHVLRILLLTLVVLLLLNYSLRSVDEAMTYSTPTP